MAAVESSLTNDEDIRRRQQLDKDISSLESKKSRMTDILIDGTISKEVYDDKMIEFNRKLHTLAGKKVIKREYQQTKRCRKANGGTSSDIGK